VDEEKRVPEDAKQRKHDVKGEEARERCNARRRARYANNGEYRETRNAKRRERYANDVEHREKHNAKQRERYANDVEFREMRCGRDSQLRWRYGISTLEFNELLHRQNHACAICERPFRETPHVDHCHLTRWVRGLLCRTCNIGLGHFGDNPAFLVKAARYMARWLLHVLQLLNRKENEMTTNDDSGGDGKATRLMRKAILHELHQPHGVDPPPPSDQLQAVARALVTKAVAHDVSAIKEILDRIDGRTPSAPTVNDLQQLVNLSWKQSESSSKMPPSKMSPSKSCKEKSKSTTGRAPNSSPSADEPSASPAS
jgi:Recombination endonuclease VII